MHLQGLSGLRRQGSFQSDCIQPLLLCQSHSFL